MPCQCYSYYQQGNRRENNLNSQISGLLMKNCPKCGSANIKIYNYLGIKAVKCSSCGFDERNIYEVYPEQKTSQKAKGTYTIYKKGGSQRTRKK